MNTALWIYAGVMTAIAVFLLWCAWMDLQDERRRAREMRRLKGDWLEEVARNPHPVLLHVYVRPAPYDWERGPDFLDPMELIGLGRDPSEVEL